VSNIQPLLQINDLGVDFTVDHRRKRRVLEGINLSVFPDAVVGLVGESGSGKTVLSHASLGLLPRNARINGGSIHWNGEDVTRFSEKQWRSVRGHGIAMIFQDSQASLNPVYSVGRQLMFVLALHRQMKGAAARAEAMRLLDSVHLRDVPTVFDQYPHQLSGGMAQRVMIAIALACEPKLLIADEATSALDVTTQVEIVTLLQEVRARLGMALVLVSHDIGLVSRLCHHVTVLNQGRVVESGTTSQVLSNPQNEYTKKLLDAARALHFSNLNTGVSLARQSTETDAAFNN
jgi:ABC-type dipeptide/oligopeptide/nickel transport system ATPase component